MELKTQTLNNLKSIIKFLNASEIEAWVSGGTARDIYLNRTPFGYDISARTTLSRLQKVLKTRVMAVNKHNASLTIEYKNTLFTIYPLRSVSLSYTYPNYNFTDSLKEDALSKDFTINSLFYNPINDSWIDYFNGRADADNKQIKFVGNWQDKILESKERLIRGPILCSILGEGWSLDFETKAHIKTFAIKSATIHPKNLFKEIENLLNRATTPSTAFKLFLDLNILDEIFPELVKTVGIDQSQKNKNLDLFYHIMYALDSVELERKNTLLIRLSALLHDIGKPYTEVYTQTGRHFYGHDTVGKILTHRILTRWGFPSELIKQVENLVEQHLFNVTSSSSTTAIKKFIARVGPKNVHDLLDLRIADRYGTGKSNISMYKVELLRKKVNEQLAKVSPSDFKLALDDGEITDILKSTTEEGFLIPSLKYVKAYLEHKVLYGRVHNKPKNLKKILSYVNNIACPLDTPHLFKTWCEKQTETAEVFPDGNLKCGVYCGFICDKMTRRK